VYANLPPTHSMHFPTTHWSQLIVLSQSGQRLAHESLDRVCRDYWRPVFAMVRLRGVAEQDAHDVTQSFFLHVLEHMSLVRADRLRGRFRTFLLGILHHFLLHERRAQTAAKRGSGIPPEELQEDTAPVIPPTESEVFDREWALAVMNRAVERARSDWIDKGRNWEVFKAFLPGGGATLGYDEAVERTGMTMASFKVELHRLRQRIMELLRAEVARTVSAPHEVEEELTYLRRTLEKAA
jgi:DNA-directed RNA polymerase specialized sigma24 family protein